MLPLAVVLAMLVCLVMIPFGIPGLWLIVMMSLGLVLAGQLTWTVGLVVAGAALLAEVGEFLVLSRFGRAYGGSRRAFWGAMIGGMAGLFVGLPVPVLGPLITGFAGTFLGAGLVTWFETSSLERSARVGWGVLLARTVAVALKVAVAVGVIAMIALQLIL